MFTPPTLFQDCHRFITGLSFATSSFKDTIVNLDKNSIFSKGRYEQTIIKLSATVFAVVANSYVEWTIAHHLDAGCIYLTVAWWAMPHPTQYVTHKSGRVDNAFLPTIFICKWRMHTIKLFAHSTQL